MLKKDITFRDFDGLEYTETFWFHLSASELAEWEFSMKGGLTGLMERMGEDMDTTQVFPVLKKLLRTSYGIRDGIRFRKTKELADDFEFHPAFDQLIVDMLKNPTLAVEFFAGILPPGTVTEAALSAEIEKVDGMIFNNVFKDAENGSLTTNDSSEEIVKKVEEMSIEELRAALATKSEQLKEIHE